MDARRNSQVAFGPHRLLSSPSFACPSALSVLLESKVERRSILARGSMAFPVTRLRRLRRTSQLRDLVRETRLTPEAFVYPMFVCPGEGVRKEVRSMPGVFNLSVDEAVKEAQEVHSLGVPAV